MAAENRSPGFGNMTFWAEADKKHREVFERFGRLQEAVRSITDPAYEGLDSGQQLQINLLMWTNIGVAEIVTLVGNGMGHGAMKIVRSVMENAINMEYMRKFPAEAEKYIEWQWVERHNLHEHLEKNSPATYAEIPQEKRDRDKEEYRRVRPLFEYLDKTGKTKVRNEWCRVNLSRRAEQVGLAQDYSAIMPRANQILHGTISGWIWDMDEVTGRIEYPPTHKWGEEALMVAHMSLMHATETATFVLNATPMPTLDILKEDFNAAWGKHPPKISEDVELEEIAQRLEDDEDCELPE